MEHVFVLNYFAEQPLKYDEAVIITPEVLQNIEIKFNLSSNGTESSAPWSKTRSLNASHDSSRFCI